MLNYNVLIITLLTFLNNVFFDFCIAKSKTCYIFAIER